jgi:predicted nuclease with TOPRIM domain
MFWDARKEEEVFLNGPLARKVTKTPKIDMQKMAEEVKVAMAEEKPPSPEAIEAQMSMEKLNRITEQVNMISRYLSYLSEKFDRTIDSAVTYDRSLDEIEVRIENLRKKIENLEYDDSFKVEKSAGKAK